jgi:hypothetical protein
MDSADFECLKIFQNPVAGGGGGGGAIIIMFVAALLFLC